MDTPRPSPRTNRTRHVQEEPAAALADAHVVIQARPPRGRSRAPPSVHAACPLPWERRASRLSARAQSAPERGDRRSKVRARRRTPTPRPSSAACARVRVGTRACASRRACTWSPPTPRGGSARPGSNHSTFCALRCVPCERRPMFSSCAETDSGGCLGPSEPCARPMCSRLLSCASADMKPRHRFSRSRRQSSP